MIWLDSKLYQVWGEKDESGYRLYKAEIGGQTIGNTLYKYETTISLASYEKINFDKDLIRLTTPGNYLIEAELKSNSGQKLDFTQEEINVLPASGISVELFTTVSNQQSENSNIFKPGENITIRAVVTNKGQDTYSGRVRIFKNDLEIYGEDITLQPAQIYECSTNTK